MLNDVAVAMAETLESMRARISRRSTRGLLIVAVVLPLSTVHAGDPSALFPAPSARSGPLPVNEAFPVQAALIEPNVVLVRWEVPPGYYLYRDKMQFDVPDRRVEIAEVCWPAATDKADPFLGQQQVYQTSIDIRLLLARPATEGFSLTAAFQGCAADAGLCYPPAHAKLEVAPAPPSEISASQPFCAGSTGAAAHGGSTDHQAQQQPTREALPLGLETSRTTSPAQFSPASRATSA